MSGDPGSGVKKAVSTAEARASRKGWRSDRYDFPLFALDVVLNIFSSKVQNEQYSADLQLP